MSNHINRQDLHRLMDWIETTIDTKEKAFKHWLKVYLVDRNEPNKRVGLWVFREGTVDQPIEKPKPMEVTLAKPIAPGFYRECEISTDEAVDKQADGSFALGALDVGDSTPPTVLDTSTAQNIKFNVYGDGALGDKHATITVDTKFGTEILPMVLGVNYTVASKEATEFSGFKEGTEDKPISVTPPVTPVEPPAPVVGGRR